MIKRKNIGPYNVLAPLGAGGMGEVWRAEDPRLGREVALKVLPDSFADDPERHTRLEREAKVLASLNHPNIATLYGLEHIEGQHVLVMELVEGEGLDERIARGPVLVGEAVQIALQIAHALEAAHGAGIVHRDLKPANILIRPDGTVKMLDFGLAKSWESHTVDGDPSLMQTATSHHTRAGVILGTAAYMAPEQAAGMTTDPRADNWSFGVVLWEMLTGQRLFGGETLSHVLASVLKDEIDLDALPPGTPARIRELIERCLRKQDTQRLQAIGDARIVLEEYMADPVASVPLRDVPASPTPRAPLVRRLVPWGVTAVLAATLVAVTAVRPRPEAPTVRFQIFAPETLTDVGAPAISPDGRTIGFTASDATGTTLIWVRMMDDLEARPLPGTEGSTRPFWSPDSRYLGFVAGGKLKKVPLAGGPPQTLADTPTASDGTWSTRGVILFDGRNDDPIRRVPASGGEPQDLVTADLDAGIAAVAWPQFLPDGRRFLFIADSTKPGVRLLMVGDVEGEEPARTLLEVTSLARFAVPDHILYVREGSLLAQPFDPDTVELRGEAVPLAQQLGTSAVGLADFSVSDNGTLVYRSGWSANRRLVWVNRDGRSEGDMDEPAVYRETALSPDGSRLALVIDDPRSNNRDIWLRDLESGLTSRFTFDVGRDHSPVFSPDGQTIAFVSNRVDGSNALYLKGVNGSGVERTFPEVKDIAVIGDWSRDGRWLTFFRTGEDTAWDIWALAMDGPDKGREIPIAQGPFIEIRPSFSPDGKWIVYESDESGRTEVYVQLFPGPGGKWQVSTDGGEEPRWSDDGTEILYLAPGGTLMSVPVTMDASFTGGRPREVLQVRLQPMIVRNRWLASRDGQRFLFVEPEEAARSLPMTVVLNWAEVLRER